MSSTTVEMADGFGLGAYVAEPEKVRGVVVVIQEIFGVNAHIREVADSYALEGYLAIAPQLFDRVEPGIELGYTDEDMGKGIELAFSKLDLEATVADLQSVITYAEQFGKVGVVGYCFGGLLTWLSACRLSGVTAAASYYGGGIVNQLDCQPQCPLIMHFGELDAHIPLSDVEKIQSANPDVPVYVYPADHGFNCNHRGSYDAEAAALARKRTLSHFEMHLT